MHICQDEILLALAVLRLDVLVYLFHSFRNLVGRLFLKGAA